MVFFYKKYKVIVERININDVDIILVALFGRPIKEKFIYSRM